MTFLVVACEVGEGTGERVGGVPRFFCFCPALRDE